MRVVIVFIVMISFANVYGQQHKITIGEAIPSFELITPEGKQYNSAELKGRVIILDFWASWCIPCRKLTGEINTLLNTYHGSDKFQMIGVNYREYNKDTALDYWKEHSYKFPMASDDDVLGVAIGAGNPTILVIDKKGIVRGRWDKYSPDVAKAVKIMVEDLM